MFTFKVLRPVSFPRMDVRVGKVYSITEGYITKHGIQIAALIKKGIIEKIDKPIVNQAKPKKGKGETEESPPVDIPIIKIKIGNKVITEDPHVIGEKINKMKKERTEHLNKIKELKEKSKKYDTKKPEEAVEHQKITEEIKQLRSKVKKLEKDIDIYSKAFEDYKKANPGIV